MGFKATVISNEEAILKISRHNLLHIHHRKFKRLSSLNLQTLTIVEVVIIRNVFSGGVNKTQIQSANGYKLLTVFLEAQSVNNLWRIRGRELGLLAGDLLVQRVEPG